MTRATEAPNVDIASLEIRPRQESDDPAIVALGNALQPEYPPVTVERYRQMARERPEAAAERWVAELRDTIVGALYLGKAFWLANPRAYTAVIRVPEALWGRGIGTRLYATLEDRLKRQEVDRIYCQIREDRPAALRFAERRGFERTGHTERMSRLEVARADLRGFERLEDRMDLEGLRITTLAETASTDDRLLRALYDLEVRTARDVPGSEEMGSSYETWLRMAIHGPGRSPDSIWIALDGTAPVGAAFLDRVGDAAWNAYTCVDRAYRGRGIARALKGRTVQWARTNGIRFMYTGNDTQSTRKLAVNKHLGYEALPAEIEMVKHLGSESELDIR